MTDGSRAAAPKGTMFHRTHMGSFSLVGGRMPEAGCRRQEAGGTRQEAGGQKLEARARGQRLEARSWPGRGVGWTYGRTYGRNQETIRCDLRRMYRSTIEIHEKSQKFVFLKGQKSAFFWSQRQFWGNFG